MQNWVCHAAKRVHHWLFSSLAPLVSACCFLAGLLLRHHLPARGIFALQEQTFSLPWNLGKCFLAQSSSWAAFLWLKLCHLACHLTLLIWCHLSSSYQVVLCPGPGHWWGVGWHGHRADPCRAASRAWTIDQWVPFKPGFQAVFSPTHSIYPGSISLWKAWKMLSNSVGLIAVCLVSVEN